MPRHESEVAKESSKFADADHFLVPFEVGSVGRHKGPEGFAFVEGKILGVGVDTVACATKVAF